MFVYIMTGCISLAEACDVVCDGPLLCPSTKSLSRVVGVVCWFEVRQQLSLQTRPALSITLYMVPSICRTLK